MKLEYVLTSCNLNPLYCDFIPIFIKAWKKLIPEIKIVIVLIAESIPEKFLNFSEYIKLFQPIENVSTAFVSQYIRILYPCILNSTGGCNDNRYGYASYEFSVLYKTDRKF